MIFGEENAEFSFKMDNIHLFGKEKWILWLNIHFSALRVNGEKMIKNAENLKKVFGILSGVAKGIWTPDPTLRRRVLYPAELLRRMKLGFAPRRKSELES